MAREINRLSARRVQALTEVGRHADGGGLYLVVDPGGARRWVMLYRMAGRRREMGLGPVLSVPLARARDLAAEARALIAGGVDPIEARRTPPSEAPPAPAVTFAMVAESYMEARAASWKNAKHRAQWRMTLEVHGAKVWAMPVADVGTTDVLGVLQPIWQTKPETASRLRGRIERVMDAARVAGHRTGDNPARWTGHLDYILPRAVKLSRGHHAALPYQDLPAFMAMLAGRAATSARALEIIVLTAGRSGEIRGMTWGEVDWAAAVWTVPGSRMKGGRIHRVPLAAAVLEKLKARRPEASAPEMLVFPSQRGNMLSDMAFEALYRRAGTTDITTHGFRSTFRDWAGDMTDHPREVIEAALAHMLGDETELAYRRGDALEKRRHLMDAWAAFALSATGAPST